MCVEFPPVDLNSAKSARWYNNALRLWQFVFKLLWVLQYNKLKYKVRTQYFHNKL